MSEWRLDPWAMAAVVSWVALSFGKRSLGLDLAMGWQTFWAKALAEGIAGVLVVAWGLRRGERLPDRYGVWALALLTILGLAERLLWRPYVDGVLHVPYLRAGVQGMVFLATPLFLAFLAAVRWVPETVPRRTAGAAIAGIAAYCLLLQATELSVNLAEVPALLLTMLYAGALVWAWSYARRTLAGVAVPVVAGYGLVLSAAVSAGAALSIADPNARGFSWAGVWGPLALTVVVTAAEAVLWFWLLQRLPLAAFSTQPLMAWVFGMLLQFLLFGFLSWRLDLALTLGIGAVLTGLRARPEDDDPVTLGVA